MISVMVFVIGFFVIRICFEFRAYDLEFIPLHVYRLLLQGGFLRPPALREEHSLDLGHYRPARAAPSSNWINMLQFDTQRQPRTRNKEFSILRVGIG